MSAQESGRERSPGVYVRELRLSLRNNSGAYGFSVLITCALAMLNALTGTPNAMQILVFALGAVASFLIVELIATQGFRQSLGGDEQTKVVALGSSFSAVSISAGIGAAALCGLVLPVTLGWFGGSLSASMTYLLLNGLEMKIARRIEEARDLA
ncbi:hypothetical protein [Qaidamihabitans albus]|uniref:hypothetical protein n=1 Tax=Qaidamihabitans albus TaxID=2795733 RepID=UPI0018F1B4B9|nr:hypothetical protein [Qaidamihabitans albus]